MLFYFILFKILQKKNKPQTRPLKSIFLYFSNMFFSYFFVFSFSRKILNIYTKIIKAVFVDLFSLI